MRSAPQGHWVVQSAPQARWVVRSDPQARWVVRMSPASPLGGADVPAGSWGQTYLRRLRRSCRPPEGRHLQHSHCPPERRHLRRSRHPPEGRHQRRSRRPPEGQHRRRSRRPPEGRHPSGLCPNFPAACHLISWTLFPGPLVAIWNCPLDKQMPNLATSH